MKWLVATALIVAPAAYAAEPSAMMAACDAPIASAIAAADGLDAQNPDWSNLNLAIQQHRRTCALPMALTCHLSSDPDACYTGTIAALDKAAEVERVKLEAFAEEGGTLLGDLPRQRARTTPARAAERSSFCAQQSSENSAYISALRGDHEAACRLEIAVAQWAVLSFSGAATKALSLLPPQ